MNFGDLLRSAAVRNPAKTALIFGDDSLSYVRAAPSNSRSPDKAYDFAIWLNTHFNAVRRVFGFTYWSLSRWAKLKVKNAVNFIGAFELALANEARRRGAEGVICGHIHHPIIRPLEGLVYVELRRLGRKLHGDHRALRWTAGDHRLDRSANWRFGSLRRAACRHWCSEAKRPLAPLSNLDWHWNTACRNSVGLNEV